MKMNNGEYLNINYFGENSKQEINVNYKRKIMEKKIFKKRL